jgi:hypothetical protein
LFQGVCLYVKDELSASVIHTSQHSPGLKLKHEVLWINVNKANNNYFIGIIYHPPKPAYKTDQFESRLASDIEELLSSQPNSILYLTGDFNQFPSITLAADTGLHQVVNEATRGPNILDMFFTNRPDTVSVKVAKSSLNTDHKALLVNTQQDTLVRPNNRQISFYDIRDHHAVQLILALQLYKWYHVLNENRVNVAYQAFLDIVKWHITEYIPMRTVTITPRTPSYITPLVKSLLRKRNKLMRRGKLSEANILSSKIGKLITEFRAKCLANVDSSSSASLWKMVNNARGKRSSAGTIKIAGQPIDVDELNRHFAAVATDSNYDIKSINKFIQDAMALNSAQSQNQPETASMLTEEEVQLMLDKVKKTSPGSDNTPYWFFRRCSFHIAPVVTHLFNLSLSTGKPPEHWQKALITPIPKISKPNCFSDLRPISVTSLLSRLFERFIVHNFLLPSIPTADLCDQFAFRPTGSTTAALVNTIHTVTKMLETNDYVRCILVDFSKAFDTINHCILFEKQKNCL